MSTLKFLCDEDVPVALVAALARLEPGMTIGAVGQPDLPSKGTKDPDLLLFAEAHGYMLLTRDKGTMRSHVTNHLAAGHHTWGAFVLREGYSVTEHAQELLLLWSASEAEEWQDTFDYFPWQDRASRAK